MTTHATTPLTHTGMVRGCPFNAEEYVAGLGGLGTPERSARGGFSILTRPIPGTDMSDGVGPWPYLWISGPDDIAALHEDFRHLLTVTAVTQPGYVPDGATVDAALLKMHYVYDPGRPPAPMSRRARLRLRRCEERASFDVVVPFARRMRMAAIHARLVSRRGLPGDYTSFTPQHVEALARLESSVFFEVRDADGIGAMACGVLFGEQLQILHMAGTDEGLRWNASYLLMAGLQQYATEYGVQLMTGGMPDTRTDGLRIFKQRWANHSEPVYLLRVVNDKPAYAALCGHRLAETPFFPAYRAPAAGRDAALSAQTRHHAQHERPDAKQA